MKNSTFLNKKAFGLILVAVTGCALLWMLLDQPRPHNPKVFGPPAKTQWKPVGAQSAGQHNYDIVPEPTT